MAAVDAKKAEIRELQDEIDSIEESTKRLIQKLETLAEMKP
jgi:ubiquinone biosynthesis protein UbiJ